MDLSGLPGAALSGAFRTMFLLRRGRARLRNLLGDRAGERSHTPPRRADHEPGARNILFITVDQQRYDALAVNGGRVKVYKGDGSEEYNEFFQEMEKAKSSYRPNQTMNFYVDAAQGHDDSLMSLALTVEAARLYEPRGAKGL